MSALSTANMSRKAGENLWEAHKGDIHEIYMKQNQSLAVLTTEMSHRFGFTATGLWYDRKAQYEHHLKKWNFTKNLTRVDWIRISRVIADRKMSGKGSEVLVHGKIISQEKLKKELHRYARNSTHEGLLTCLEKLNASGIHIQDPETSFDDSHSPPGEVNAPQDLEDIQPLVDMGASTTIAIPVSQTAISAFTSWGNIDVLHSTRPISPLFDRLEPEDRQGVDISISNSYEADFAYPFSPLRLEQPIWHIGLTESLLLQDSLMNAGSHSLASLLPRDILPRGFSGGDAENWISTTDTECLKRIAVYMLVNAVISPTSEKLIPFLKWLQTQQHHKWFRSALSRDDPESHAARCNTFRYAVLSENLEILGSLTKTKYQLPVDVPHSWFYIPHISKTQTPLSFALSVQNLELVRFLHTHGAELTGFTLWEIFRNVKFRRMARARISKQSLGTIRANVNLIVYLLQNGLQSCQCMHRSKIDMFPYIDSERSSWFYSVLEWGDVELLAAMLKRDATRHCFQRCMPENWKSSLGKTLPVSPKTSKITALLVCAGVRLPWVHLCTYEELNMLKSALNLWTYLEPPKPKFYEQADLQFVYEALKLLQQHSRIDAKSADRGNATIEAAIAHLASTIHSSLLEDLLVVANASNNYALASALLGAGGSLESLFLPYKDIRLSSNLIRAYLDHTTYPISPSSQGFIWKAAIDASDSLLIPILTKVLDVNIPIKYSNGSPAIIMRPFTYAILTNKRSIALALFERLIVNGPALDEIPAHIPFFDIPIILSSLDVAIQKADMELIQQIIKSGANLFDDRALYSAVWKGEEMVQVILEAIHTKTATPTYAPAKFGVEALQAAIVRRDFSVVRLLLDYGISVSSPVYLRRRLKQRSPFEIPGLEMECAIETAIRTDRTSELRIFRMIMDSWNKSRDMESQLAQSGIWPLSLAVKHANYAVTELLIRTNGATYPEVARTYTSSHSPLHEAVEVGNIELVQLLLIHGAEIDLVSRQAHRSTALQIAARKGFHPIVKLLCETGANVDAVSGGLGKTALEEAAAHGHVDIIRLLVHHGAQLCGAGVHQFERAKNFAEEHGWDGAITVLDSLLREQLLQRNSRFTGLTNQSDGFNVGLYSHTAERVFEQGYLTTWTTGGDCQQMQGEFSVAEIDSLHEGSIIGLEPGFVYSEGVDSMNMLNVNQ